MNRMRFRDKVVIVTGGAMGIGAAACESFAKEGAKLVIADINEAGQGLSDRLSSAGLDTMFIKTDVTREYQVIDLINKTVEKHGRLDIMCANAGIMLPQLPNEWTESDADQTLAVNVKGVLFCDKYAVEQMLKQEKINDVRGVIVNTGSTASFVARPNNQLYIASKGAVKTLTQSYALGYATEGIRINCFCPGGIITPLMEEVIKARGEEVRAYLATLHPIGRTGTPQEAANAMLFLASEESSFITGACLSVDGGLTTE